MEISTRDKTTGGDNGMKNDLEKRVGQFKTLSLPDQPLCGHRGTSYLIHDLWREIERLRTAKTDNDKVLMPRELTAENGANALLSGEFFETREVGCPECYREGSPCEVCGSTGSITEKTYVSWTNIKAIYKKAVEALGDKA